jgi:hypothetical protein
MDVQSYESFMRIFALLLALACCALIPDVEGAGGKKRSARDAGGNSQRGGLFSRKRYEITPTPAPASSNIPSAPLLLAIPLVARPALEGPPMLPGATSASSPGPHISGHQRQLRVFVLGDSQCHTEFGPELQKALLEGGYEVLIHGFKNGTVYFWKGGWTSPVLTQVFEPARTPEESGHFQRVSMVPPSIRDYVAAYDPDVFLIQGGTNFEQDLAAEPNTYVLEQVHQCLLDATAMGAKILWIGPPDARDDVKTPDFQARSYAAIHQVTEPFAAQQEGFCLYDSRPSAPMANDAPGDGEHHGPSAARAWARDASGWIHGAIATFSRDSAFLNRVPREGSGPAMHKVALSESPSITPGHAIPGNPLASGDDVSIPERVMTMELRLSAKSLLADPQTMEYTDFFSVFRYELENPDAVLPLYPELKLSQSGSGDEAVHHVYVFHWTAHHDGIRPDLTVVAGRPIGSTVTMDLVPLREHPLAHALGNMPQQNDFDFDDFGAPIFVTPNLIAESELVPKVTTDFTGLGQ